MTKLWIVALLTLASCGGASHPPANRAPDQPPAKAAGVADAKAASAALEKRIGVQCKSFEVVAEDPAHFDIDVHEVHGGDCPGDPNTHPIFGRFRVARDGAITKENPATTEWEPLP